VNLFHLKKEYMKALEKQLAFELEKYQDITLKSIFIGGGTPSSVEAHLYIPIFEILKKYINKNTEITTEANPNSASIVWQKTMKELGVNRISFGVQSFNNEKLKFLGRNHNNTQAISAINIAKEIGFEHINCDIIYDTAVDTKELIDNDLQTIKTLPIDHISAYSLTIEEGTKFFKKPEVRIEDINMAHHVFSKLTEYGFHQYEISNFSKSDNAKSTHNFGYWKKEDYIGVGAGAVGCVQNLRYYPIKDVQAYIDTPLDYEDTESISPDDIKFETIFLGLRSEVGVDLNIFTSEQLEKINLLLNEGKLIKNENRVYNKDFLLTDEIVLFID
jgi:oxygen-independent coproporphyrinogen-3 oxidase